MRRIFCALLAVVALASPAAAQPATKLPIVARLSPGSPTDPAEFQDEFFAGMAALGHVEGRTYKFVARYADGDAARLIDQARELARSADVIVASGTAIGPALAATKTVPIVMANSGVDPVRAGYVKTFARPGGNVTGFSGQIEERHEKQIELLREAVPNLTAVCVLHNRATEAIEDTLGGIADVAARLNLALIPAGIVAGEDIETVIARDCVGKSQAILVLSDLRLLNRAAGEIAALTLRRSLPTMFTIRVGAEVGGFLSYAIDLREMRRRSAVYVDKILKGANPGDLPVEQPTNYDLVVNMKTARALGMTVPQSIILRADEVIE